MVTTVVFIGDSITEDGRRLDDPTDLGVGYVARVARQRRASGAEERTVNSGIGGNRAIDLVGRWDRDCLAHAPDLVSIHVGINDTWRRYDQGEATSTASFAAHYRGLVEQTVAVGARLVLIEPFLLPVAPGQASWREDLDPKIEVVRSLAREFDATLVEADVAFTEQGGRTDPGALLHDGVHPTDAGRDLLAHVWSEAVTR